MKTLKVIIISSFVMLSSVMMAFSQTEKGKFFLGGETNLNFTSMNSELKFGEFTEDTGKTSTLEVSPKFGKFIVDDLVLGLEIPIAHYAYTPPSGNKSKLTTFAIAPFGRYYFGPPNPVKPYLQGMAGYGIIETNGGGDSGSILLYEIAGGIGIFLNEKVALDIQLGYGSTNYDYDGDYKEVLNGLDLGLGFTIIM
ncbi:outer membrane beta-barrel protein [Echinicola jeungdonensis]|uniref:Outer membrane beta-barrel protein n=1 Tax=Echinicola jeungdonensis TaxID=709343 RepID=A0ABV5J2K4_9BACT|nr:outer membrane beta-barrel protein [Echinicola jeungdonensis]MDN3668270.1 outer membrane beta-barrel protein [Echinicola jeungdonensis]